MRIRGLFRGAARTVFNNLILKKDAHRRGVGVIVLSGAHRYYKGSKEQQGHNDADGQQDINHTHVALFWRKTKGQLQGVK